VSGRKVTAERSTNSPRGTGKKTDISEPATLKCGALFAGIGGFCLGFEQAGFETAWAVELSDFAVSTYRQNLPHVRLLPKSVKGTSVVGDQLESVDVLHAGFPCQSFSQAGERRGFDDPRGKLFYEIIRLIEEFGTNKPKVLVLENAPFLRYGEGGAWFLELQRAIRKAGYWFRPENSCELSANALTPLPQQRTRLFMVALSMDAFRAGRFEFPSTRDPSPKEMSRYIDFDGHADDEYYLPNENRYFKMISSTVKNRECLYQLRKYEVRPQEPGVCPTLTANMGLGGHNVPFIMNSRGLRKLTEYECLRLQGFPDGFTFPDDVPRAKRYIQVGNAVTVPVAELLAQQVRARLEQEER
jgi:DNA (cytosine-5)-methyltransferase 1